MNLSGSRDIAGRRAPYRARLNGARGGATLAEVLIALLILGIGLVSVATLFPLSLLRSVRATQLTNAAILRQNAEMYLAGATTGATDSGFAPYAILADPDAADSGTSAGGTGINVADTDGLNLAYDDGLQAFVFDPLGVERLGNDANADGDVDLTDPAETVDAFGGVHARLDGGLSLIGARTAATLGDGTTEAGQIIPISVATTSPTTTITLPTGDEADAILDAVNPLTTRVVLESADGTRSATRDVTGVTASPPSIDVDEVPSFLNGAGNFGRLIVENEEDRYSWIATVRRDSDPDNARPRTAAVYLATFFRRSFGGLTTDEQPYRFIEGSDPSQPFFVAWPDTATPPRIKKGAWFCNLQDLRWYLVTDVLAQFREQNVPSEFQLYSDPNDLSGDSGITPTPPSPEDDFASGVNENVIAFSISPEFYVPITGRVTGIGATQENNVDAAFVSGGTTDADRYDPAGVFGGPPELYPRAIFPRGVITVFPFTISSIP